MKLLGPFLNETSLHIKFLVSSILEKAFMKDMNGFLEVFDSNVLGRILAIAAENFRPKYIKIQMEIFWNIVINQENKV